MNNCRLPPICNDPGVTCRILPTPSVVRDNCGNTQSYRETVVARVPPRNCR